jgi:hypothetical protein
MDNVQKFCHLTHHRHKPSEFTYLVGSYCVRDGPQILINSNAEVVFVNREALDDVWIRLICENNPSHSLDEIAMLYKAHLRGNNLSGNVFSSRSYRNPCIISLSLTRNIWDSFRTFASPYVTLLPTSSGHCIGSSTLTQSGKSVSSLSNSFFSTDNFFGFHRKNGTNRGSAVLSCL